MLYVVKPNEIGLADLSSDELSTEGLQSCIAPITVEDNIATLAHLTLHSNIDEYLRWLSTHVERPDVYLVGGWNPFSKHFIGTLRNAFGDYGYSILESDILSTPDIQKDVHIDRSGIKVTHNRLFRRMDDEELVPVFSSYLKRLPGKASQS